LVVGQKKTHKRGSDVDLAIKDNLSNDQVREIEYWLNEETLLPYYFDLVLYNDKLDSQLREHIDRVGLRLIL